MGYRNAAELAVSICAENDPSVGKQAAPMGSPGGALNARLRTEQVAMVHEALEAFGHARRRAELPTGTVQDCLR